jgi:hypothetical protein
VYLAHACYISDSGPFCFVDSVRRVQLLWIILLLLSLSFSFFSMRLRAPLKAIKLLTAPNFEFS